jgi:hypothetical protein
MLKTSSSNSVRRNIRPSSHTRRWILSAAVIVATVFTVAALWPEPDHDSSVAAVIDEPREALVPVVQPASSTSVSKTGSRRSIFRHSVVPGGVYSDGELRAAMRDDPVVAAHYKAIGRVSLRAEVVPHDRMVYVSYRRGDDIYWTGKKVLLRAGETILTDGSTQIRARCGNCISETPVAPLADVEPDVDEFDALAPAEESDPEDEDSPVAAGGGSAPGLVAAGPAGHAVAPSDPAPFVFPSSSPGPFVQWGGGLPSAAGSTSDEPAAQSEPPSDEKGPSQPVDEPPTDDSPSTDKPVVTTPADNPTVDDPPVDNPPVDTVETPIEPELNPVPVPEPGTFLLVGGGAAVLVRRMRSRTARRPRTDG